MNIIFRNVRNRELTKFSKELSGKWVAVGGNRWISPKTSKEVALVTKKLIDKKCKIVTGGAEGTDHIVMKSCLKYKPQKDSLKIFLPYTIQKQYEHYCRLEGARKAKSLLQTLSKIKKNYPNSIIENYKKFKNYRKAADFRNNLITKQANGAIMFKPVGSKGTLYTLNKIKTKGIPYIIFY